MLRSASRELLDGPVESIGELEANLRDIARANRFLGGTAIVRNALRPYKPRTIVDAGSGSADIPRALIDDARARQDQLCCACVDSSAEVLAIARAQSSGYPELTFVQADGAKLPFDDGAFDIAICNLTLHHCDRDAAVSLLRELRRVARVAPVVTDLRRSRIAWIAARLLTLVFTTNRLTRNDAPLSVLRAYAPEEALELAQIAGWRNARVRLAPFYRMVLTDG